MALNLAASWIILLALPYWGTVCPALIYTNTPKVNGTYRESVTLRFFTNFSAPNLRFTSLVVKTDRGEIAIGSKGSFITDNPNPFGVRLKAEPPTPPYTLKLEQLEFDDDNITFVGTVLYYLNDVTLLDAHATIDLAVFGGPLLCGTDLGAKTSIDNATTAVMVSLCGLPKPTVSWTLDGKAVNGTVSHREGKLNYTYSYPIDNTDPSFCGMVLKYTATGYSTSKSRETTLQADISPTITSVYSYRINDTCWRTEWTALEYGRCTGLKYDVEYLSAEGSVVHTAVLTTPNQTFCRTGGMAAITNIRARGSFNGKVGFWREAVNTSTTRTDKDDTMTIVAAVCGTIGAILLIIIIWIVVYCLCFKEKQEKVALSKSNSFGFQHPKKKSKKKKSNSEAQNGTLDGRPAPSAAEKDIKYFDPEEFGLKEQDVTKPKTDFENPSFKNEDDEFTNRPTFLI